MLIDKYSVSEHAQCRSASNPCGGMWVLIFNNLSSINATHAARSQELGAFLSAEPITSHFSTSSMPNVCTGYSLMKATYM